MLVEILSVNLPLEMREYRDDDRFVAYVNPRELGTPMSHQDAVRMAAGLGIDGSVGFIANDPEPVILDWRQPQVAILNKKKHSTKRESLVSFSNQRCTK